MKPLFSTIILAVLATASLNAYGEPPGMSGNVIRFDANKAWLFFDARDPDNPLTVVFGADPVEICAFGIFDPEQVSIQHVVIQDGERIINLEKAEVYTSAWASVGFDCGHFLSNPPLATGMAKVRIHDSDLDPTLNPDRTNIKTQAFKLNGVLESPAGTPRPLQLSFHAIWDGVDPATYKQIFRLDLR